MVPYLALELMNTAEMYPLAASVFGFVAAVCFCAGAASSSSKQILAQSSTYWNFNKHLAHSLCAQRAQYAVGAVLLVLSFLFQSASVLKLPEIPLQGTQSAFAVFVAMLVITSLPTVVSVKAITYVTEKRVLERCAKEEAEYQATRKK